MNPSEKLLALEFLKNFFSEMNAWEEKFYPQVRALLESDAAQEKVDVIKNNARTELGGIYDKFGITGKKNRNRIDGLSLSDPPTYERAPQIQSEIEESDKAITYVVKKINLPQGLYRYLLKKKSDQWILAKREFFDHEEKWRPFAF